MAKDELGFTSQTWNVGTNINLVIIAYTIFYMLLYQTYTLITSKLLCLIVRELTFSSNKVHVQGIKESALVAKKDGNIFGRA